MKGVVARTRDSLVCRKRPIGSGKPGKVECPIVAAVDYYGYKAGREISPRNKEN